MDTIADREWENPAHDAHECAAFPTPATRTSSILAVAANIVLSVWILWVLETDFRGGVQVRTVSAAIYTEDGIDLPTDFEL